MKKLIFSAFIATALFVSSCGKDDDNGGGSTSLTGDWYLYNIYNDPDGNGKSWASPDNCSEKSYYSISDKKIKYEWYGLEGSECKYAPRYYNYTINNGVINMTVAEDSPNDKIGSKSSVKYEMKGKELFFSFKSGGYDVITVLHKKGVDYSYLDPLVGLWELTKIEAGGTTYPAGTPACFTGSIVASSIGFSLYYTLPANSTQCQAGKVESYDYVKEGNKYYNVTDPQNKEELALVFSENNTKLSYSEQTQNGLVTLYFTKVK